MMSGGHPDFLTVSSALLPKNVVRAPFREGERWGRGGKSSEAASKKKWGRDSHNYNVDRSHSEMALFQPSPSPFLPRSFSIIGLLL